MGGIVGTIESRADYWRSKFYDILIIVSENSGFEMDEILSEKRNKDLVLARHVFMYICRNVYSQASLMDIKNFLGKKDHTTIMHGVSRVDNDLRIQYSDTVNLYNKCMSSYVLYSNLDKYRIDKTSTMLLSFQSYV